MKDHFMEDQLLIKNFLVKEIGLITPYNIKLINIFYKRSIANFLSFSKGITSKVFSLVFFR